VDDRPVVLLYGATPSYRDLAEGATADAVTGRDVAQLNLNLIRLGDVERAAVAGALDQFSWATKAGVEALQAHLHVEETGALDRGAVVFLPGPVRVERVAAGRGRPAGGLVLTATSTERRVALNLDTGLVTEVRRGQAAQVTLPSGQVVAGRVATVGAVATAPSEGSGDSPSAPTVAVSVRLSGRSGRLDAAPVTVTITTAVVRDTLVVPIVALLASAGGGYAVERVEPSGRHVLEPVTLGMFDDADGVVQVTSDHLAAGQRVVVPAS
jgi:hypothetical protein